MRHPSSVTWFLIKLGIRFVTFGIVFGVVAWKMEEVTIKPRYAVPLVAGVFALLNTALYWLLKPILNLATLGSLAILMPFILNGAFLYATERIVKPLQIEGLWAKVVISAILTGAHGVLWVALDVIAT
jgi:uncharacterized membrane protein YvlD (DUF360 family)